MPSLQKEKTHGERSQYQEKEELAESASVRSKGLETLEWIGHHSLPQKDDFHPNILRSFTRGEHP